MYTLHWQPPYDWRWMFEFLGARAVVGVETVTGEYYERSLVCKGHQGLFRVTPDINNSTLRVTLSEGLIPVAKIVDADCAFIRSRLRPAANIRSVGRAGSGPSGITPAGGDGCV